MKEQIAIVTDSACDLSREYINQHDVFVLPLRLIYPEGEYRCGA